MSSKIVPIHYKKLIKIFKLAGFNVSRQKGDHIAMTKVGVSRPLIIKTSPHKVAVTHIMTNLRTAGIKREEYFKYLKKV